MVNDFLDFAIYIRAHTRTNARARTHTHTRSEYSTALTFENFFLQFFYTHAHTQSEYLTALTFENLFFAGKDKFWKEAFDRW